MGCRSECGKLVRPRAPCASRQGPQPQRLRHADPWPAPPSAGASRPPGRALASLGAGGTGLCGGVPRGRGKRMRFLIPPKGAIPFPGSGRFSRQAGGRIAFSAPCQKRRKRRFPALTVNGCAARPFSPAPLKAQSICPARWAIRAIWANARARSLRSSNWLANASASCCKS